MKQTTLDLIHRRYQEALEKGTNLMEISEILYKLLNNDCVDEEDEAEFDTFLDGLVACIRNRKKTFEITNLSYYLIIYMIYIILWLNDSHNRNLNVNWYARRKSLESDLTKILNKSSSELSVNIRDRFGLRCIVLNNDSEDEINNKIYSIYDAIVGIVAAKNRRMKNEFIQWIRNNDLNPIDRKIVESLFEMPFAIDFVKDYIKNPKQNGYQSLQFTLLVPVYSEVLPGCQIEVQLRSQKMHEDATIGASDHEEYKKEQVSNENQKLDKVFIVDDFKKVHVLGFKNYESKEDDKDGIHFAKEFADRRISSTFVSSTNF